MTQTIFPVYKSLGISSFQVVRQLRAITGVRKIGHAGTLDPLAEGVLVVGISREGTRQLSQYLLCDKEYLAEIKLGATTTTGDREGEEQLVENAVVPTLAELKVALEQFMGEIWQTPHDYSAVKIKGKPAYKIVRSGGEVKLKPKRVKIFKLEILDYQFPIVKLRAAVGSGVYIRSLARDLGEKLGMGAYLTSLVRTRVGEFKLEEAQSVEEIGERWRENN